MGYHSSDVLRLGAPDSRLPSPSERSAGGRVGERLVLAGGADAFSEAVDFKQNMFI